MHLYDREELQKYINSSVSSYFDMDNDAENSVYFENYSLDDDEGNPYNVTARFFYLPNMYNATEDVRF